MPQGATPAVVGDRQSTRLNERELAMAKVAAGILTARLAGSDVERFLGVPGDSTSGVTEGLRRDPGQPGA